MENKIKMGIVEIDGVCNGDVIESMDAVVVGFGQREGGWVVFLNGKIDGEWFEYCRGSEDDNSSWSVDLKELKDIIDGEWFEYIRE
jgi:hypothetical protein